MSNEMGKLHLPHRQYKKVKIILMDNHKLKTLKQIEVLQNRNGFNERVFVNGIEIDLSPSDLNMIVISVKPACSGFENDLMRRKLRAAEEGVAFNEKLWSKRYIASANKMFRKVK